MPGHTPGPPGVEAAVASLGRMSEDGPRGRPVAVEEAAPSDAEMLDAALEAFAEHGFAGRRCARWPAASG